MIQTESRKLFLAEKKKLIREIYLEKPSEEVSLNLNFFDFVEKYRPDFSYSGAYKYLREPIQKALDKEKKIVFAKGSQIGVTEAFLSYALFMMKEHKKNVFYMLPTTGDVSGFSAGRVNVVIEENFDLKKSFSFDNVQHKRCGRANLYLRGGNSPSQIKSVPVSLLIIDEIDEIPASSVEIVRERLSGSLEKQEIDVSTPTLPDVGIWKEFLLSEKYNYYVSCIFCKKKQYFNFDDNINIDREELFCRYCKKVFSHEQKVNMIKEGEWIKESEGNGKGFHISQIYSSTVSADEICKKYKEIDGETKKQVFFNHKLGLPYVAEGARLSGELVDSRRGRLNNDSVRFMGIDVSQSNYHYCIIISVHDAGIIIEHAFRSTWEDLPKYCLQHKIKCCVIDANPERHSARKFQELAGCLCYLALYPNMNLLFQLDDDKELVKISRTEIIDIIFNRFKEDHILIQENIKEYEKLKNHLCSTVRQYREKKEGIFEAYYQEVSDDHYLHALCYAEIASRILSTSQDNFDESFI